MYYQEKEPPLPAAPNVSTGQMVFMFPLDIFPGFVSRIGSSRKTFKDAEMASKTQVVPSPRRSRSTAGRRTILCLEERMPFSDLDDSIILYIETFITSRKVIHVLNANDFLLLLFPISIFRGVKSPVPPSEGMHFFDWLPTT